MNAVACPVSVTEHGVKFKPEEMVTERLYHCIYHGKAILAFKDSQDMLNCYEIEDEDLVERISRCSDDSELSVLFDAYLAEARLNG